MEFPDISQKWQVVATVIALVITGVLGMGLNEYFVPRETHDLTVATLRHEMKAQTEIHKATVLSLRTDLASTEQINTLQLMDFRIDYLRIKVDYLAQRKLQTQEDGVPFPSLYQLDLDASIAEYTAAVQAKEKTNTSN